MRGALLWSIGLLASTGLHAGGAALYLTTQRLDAPPVQPSAESRFKLETVTAPRQDAQVQTPQGDQATQAEPQGAALNAGAIAQSTAQAITPSGEAISSDNAATAAQSVRAETALGTDIRSNDAASFSQQIIAEAAPNATNATDLAGVLAQAVTASLTPQTATLASAVVPQQAATTVSLPGVATAAAAPIASQAMTAQPTPATALAPAPPRPDTAQRASAKGKQAATVAPTGQVAKQPDLPASQAKADTALQLGDRLITDPKALATIQAFMAPSEIENADQVKDDLANTLTQTDCARISATYRPETGTLEMQGHIPDPALRDGIVAALQAQVGEGIAVTANLLHLPSPQCNALTGISEIGLPQSTDQFTNERLIGSSPHAREYSYRDGQRLQFDLVAPDYDAVVYVDYFAADGTVIHLVPNEYVGLKMLEAKSLIGVGTDQPGEPGLKILIGPPYGQEIAVAFASSHPLYGGLRPIVEPAEPYLSELKDLISNARAKHSDFKGEWVYFFITTKPATP